MSVGGTGGSPEALLLTGGPSFGPAGSKRLDSYVAAYLPTLGTLSDTDSTANSSHFTLYAAWGGDLIPTKSRDQTCERTTTTNLAVGGGSGRKNLVGAPTLDSSRSYRSPLHHLCPSSTCTLQLSWTTSQAENRERPEIVPEIFPANFL